MYMTPRYGVSLIFPITSSRWIRAMASMPPKPRARSVVWRIACSTASAVTVVAVWVGRVKRRSSVIWVMPKGLPRRRLAHADRAMRMLSGADRAGPQRDLEHHARAPGRRSLGPDAPAMGRGDRRDDRQAQTGAARVARAGPVEAMEPVEDRGALIDRDARAVVVDEEPQPAARGLDAERDDPVLGRMGDRVAQEVAQGLGQAALVGLDQQLGDRAELQPAPARVRQATDQIGQERPQLDDPGAQEPLLPRLSEQEHVLHEAAHALHLQRDELLDAPHLGRVGLVGEGEDLELAADDGQRGAQLVRGVGDERRLAVERVLEAVE